MPLRKNNADSGYGILMIVMLLFIVSLAAGLFVVSASSLLDSEGTTQTKEELNRLGFAISSTNYPPGSQSVRHYEQDVAALPNNLADLVTKPVAVAACSYNSVTYTVSGWCGPYWGVDFSGETAFLDFWGKNIVFDRPGRRIYSIGPNGTNENGGGDDIVQTF